MEYRKTKGTDSWHWCITCTNWPVLNFARKLSKPTFGAMCKECKTINKNK